MEKKLEPKTESCYIQTLKDLWEEEGLAKMKKKE